MSDNSPNGVDRISSKLVLPVVIVAELKLDADKVNSKNT
jgi:hypothetical protein